MSETTGQIVVSLALLAAYTVLTALGHDGNLLLGAWGGHAAGAGSTAIVRRPKE